MTLKNRNSFIKVFLLSSLILFLFMLATLIYSIATKNILVPPAIRLPDFFDHIPFLRNSFLAVMLSFSIIFIYIPISFFLLIKYFENTQTSEIIFFTGFLIACMAESARFLTICLGLWQSFSDILIFAGKVVLFGRTLAPLSFLCAALFSETSQRQDVERNYIIMMTASVVFAAIIPMNTARIASTGLVTEGFMVLINIFRLLLFVTTTLSFLVLGIKKNSLEHKHLASSSFLLILGYSMIVSCDTFVFLILGTAGLAFGTYRYLYFIHKMYMWS